MSVILYVLSILVLLIPGAAIASYLNSEVDDLFFWGFLSLFYGATCTAMWMTILGLFSLPWTLPTIILPICIPSVYVLYRKRKHIVLRLEKSQLLFSCVAFPILISLTIRSLTGTVSHWDFMLHWAAKSRQYYLGHLFDPQYLLWPWHHHLKPDYPHLVTNLFTFQALMMSQFNDRLMMLNDVIFVAALFYVVFILIRKIVYQWYVSFMVFLGFSLLFVSFVINTRTVGGADLLFSSLAGCVVYYFHEYGERRQYSALRNMFIFLGILSYTKFEGLFYSALFSVMIAICLFVKKQHFKMMLRSLLWYGCIVAPWLAVTTYFHLNTQASAGSAILSRIGLLPALLQGFLETLLQPTWYGAWIFFATSYAYILVFRKRVGLLPITLLLLCIYLVIYLTNSDPIYYLQSSLGRLLLPLFVLCVYDFISAFRVRTAA